METINHECYVSSELAKLLKQAGFDWECDYHYADNTLCHGFCNNDPMFKIIISAPTLDVTQRWLREVKGIEVNVLCVYIVNDKKYSYDVFEGKYNRELIKEGFDTYEEALEAGIKIELELILKKEE